MTEPTNEFDRFALLRQALPQERYGDDDVACIAQRCCEIEFAAGAVVMDVGQPADQWLIVAEGAIDISDGQRRWRAGCGAIIQPSGPGHRGVSIIRMVAAVTTTILQVTAIKCPEST